MQTFKYSSKEEYRKAIKAETSKAKANALWDELDLFDEDLTRKATVRANTRAKAEMEEAVATAVKKQVGNHLMTVQVTLDAYQTECVSKGKTSSSLSDFIAYMNDENSDTRQSLVGYFKEQQTAFSLREQWVQGKRKLEL